MTLANNTLKNLQALVTGNDLVQSFEVSIISDHMSPKLIMGVVVKLKDGQIFQLKFAQSAETAAYQDAEFVIEPEYTAILRKLLEVLQPAPKKTDWNLRKIKFVLGEINSWSKDPSTKVSAAIFNGKYPICSSYNGFPPGVEDTVERLNNRPLKYKLIQHAEANAISTCARLGIKTEGMSIAVSLFPCAACAGMIIAAGIKEVITVEPSEDAKSRWGEDFEISKTLFSEAGVKVVMVSLDTQ